MIKYRVNPHAHSIHSDGDSTMEQINDIAHNKKTHIFVTDHNNVDGHKDFESPLIGAGVEVKVDSGVDILICGEREGILMLFEQEIEHLLDPNNPIYGTVNISATELTGIAEEMGHTIILPHIGTAEGALILPENEQAELARKRVLVEYNGRIGKGINRLAKRFAQKFRLATIAGGDSHISAYDQYTSTYTKIRSKEELTSAEMLQRLKKRKGAGMRISAPGIMESLATGKQILKAGGMKMLQIVARCKRKQLFGT
jgi:predicted metal-dependent phosphoesterase TrpH